MGIIGVLTCNCDALEAGKVAHQHFIAGAGAPERPNSWASSLAGPQWCCPSQNPKGAVGFCPCRASVTPRAIPEIVGCGQTA